MKPRALFVSPSRYRLAARPPLARKWEALGQELDIRVLASHRGGPAGDATFRLDRDHGLAVYYATLSYRIAREARAFAPDVIVAQSRTRRWPRGRFEGARKCCSRCTATGTQRRGCTARVPALSSSRSAVRSRARPFAAPTPCARCRRIRAASYARSASSLRRSSPAYFDESAFTSRETAPLPKRPSVLFVGVLERYKNVDGLAEAWRLVAKELPGGTAADHRQGTTRPRRSSGSWPSCPRASVVGSSCRVGGGGRARRAELAPAPVSLGRAAARRDGSILPAGGRWSAHSRAGYRTSFQDGVNGVLVDPHDPASIAAGVVRVLGDPPLLERLAAAAAADAGRWLQTPRAICAAVRRARGANALMRRLIFMTQAATTAHPVLGATLSKIRALAERVDEVVVLADSIVPEALPENCRAHSFAASSQAARGARCLAALARS